MLQFSGFCVSPNLGVSIAASIDWGVLFVGVLTKRIRAPLSGVYIGAPEFLEAPLEAIRPSAPTMITEYA